MVPDTPGKRNAIQRHNLARPATVQPPMADIGRPGHRNSALPMP
jgi:hypothetical protein